MNEDLDSLDADCWSVLRIIVVEQNIGLRRLCRETSYTRGVVQSRVKRLVNLDLVRRDSMRWPVYPTQRGIEAVALEESLKERIRSKSLADYAVHDPKTEEVMNVEKPPDILKEEGLLDEDGELDPWALLRAKDRQIAELIERVQEGERSEEEADQLFVELVKAHWCEANSPTFKKLPMTPKHLNLLERRKRSQQN